MPPIRKVAVIGAGVMGASIAAQVANGGVPVLLLDIVPEGAANRSAVAEGAVARMLKTDPAPFISARASGLVETGNIEDDLGKLAECDWIIEAVIEQLAVKQALYRRIDAVRRAGCAVSSNTSTIQLRDLLEDMPDGFRRHFMITHFFNPPRHMRLLEVIPGDADPEIVAAVGRFADVTLGKTVVACHDTPGFIANRVGNYWVQLGMVEAADRGLAVEEADAVIGPPFGIPKTGLFGLLDLVGIDLIPHVSASMARTLPEDDPFHAANRHFPLLRRMIAAGLTGRKGKGGFYRLERHGGRTTRLAIDLATGEYRPETKAALQDASDMRALLASSDRLGDYGWAVMGRTLAYAATLVPDIADDIVSVDTAMRLGYNWSWGPFELIDRLSAAWLAERLEQAGETVPKLLRQLGKRSFYRVEAGRMQFFGADGSYHDVTRPEGVLLLADVKRHTEPLLRNGSAALWDIGDGVACFEFTGKANTLDAAVVALLEESIATVRKSFKALVIYSETGNFSLGANLSAVLSVADAASWDDVEAMVASGQRVLAALKYAPFPVVSAPAGMALGGGCEILLHSDAVQAHAELYAGLVEIGVGLIPGWGGCKEMLLRWSKPGVLPKGPMPAAAKVFELVSTATVSKSAADAREMRVLRPDDGITMNRDRLLADAKQRALRMAQDYAPPLPPELKLPGRSGALAMRMSAEAMHRRGLATPHDLVVVSELATVLSGGGADIMDSVHEQHVLDLERAGVMRLLQTPPTRARIEHTLVTGRPLRN